MTITVLVFITAYSFFCYSFYIPFSFPKHLAGCGSYVVGWPKCSFLKGLSHYAWIGFLCFLIDIYHRLQGTLRDVLCSGSSSSLLWSSSPTSPWWSASVTTTSTVITFFTTWFRVRRSSKWLGSSLNFSSVELFLSLLVETFVTLELRLLDQQNRRSWGQK